MVLLFTALPACFECFLLALVTLTCHGGLVSLELVARENNTIDGRLHTDLKNDNVSSYDMIVMNVFLDFSVSKYVALYSIRIRLDLRLGQNKFALNCNAQLEDNLTRSENKTYG